MDLGQNLCVPCIWVGRVTSFMHLDKSNYTQKDQMLYVIRTDHAQNVLDKRGCNFIILLETTIRN